MSYRAQYALSVLVGVLGAILTVVLAGAPGDYGLTPVAFKWLGALAAGLVVIAGALPSWRRPPNEKRKGRD